MYLSYDNYKRQLENRYPPVCHKCQITVNQVIEAKNKQFSPRKASTTLKGLSKVGQKDFQRFQELSFSKNGGIGIFGFVVSGHILGLGLLALIPHLSSLTLRKEDIWAIVPFLASFMIKGKHKKAQLYCYVRLSINACSMDH